MAKQPRMPKWAMMYDVQIEPLSGDVSVKLTDTFVDEFTGEVKPMATQSLQVIEQRKQDAKVLEDYLQRQKAQRIKAEQDMQAFNERQNKVIERILRRRGLIVDDEPKLAFNQVLTESGFVITPKVPRKPWRRM